jgi:hypothetical protein
MRWLQWVRRHQKLFIPESQKKRPAAVESYQDGISIPSNSINYSPKGNGHSPSSARPFGEPDGEAASASAASPGRRSRHMKAVIQLHHLLSPGLVSFALVLILLLSVTAAVLWITLGPDPLGLPPRSHNSPSRRVQPALSSGLRTFRFDLDINQVHTNWKDVVSARVPGGFVLGFVVMSFGVVGLVGWLGVSILAWRRAPI